MGEALLDEQGVLHGWCLDPAYPNLRLTVDILSGREVLASLVASRFREDLRARNFGDGYHGFSLTLSRQVALASTQTVLRARERRSQTVFWQKTFGEFAIPPDFEGRMMTLRRNIRQLAASPDLALALAQDEARILQDALVALGGHLQSQTGTLKPLKAVSPAPAAPEISAVFQPGPAAEQTQQNLELARPWLAAAEAETILLDDGGDRLTPFLQRDFSGLKYLLIPGGKLADLRNEAVKAARGRLLVFFGAGGPGSHSPAQLAMSGCAATAIIPQDLAEPIRRISPGLSPGLSERKAPPLPGLRLAAPRHWFTRIGPFDPALDDGAGLDILDWVLRALRDGAAVEVTRASVTANTPSARPAYPEAGLRFAERWVMHSGLTLPPAA